MASATETQLGELHVLVAQTMMLRIANPELCTPADLSAAIRFLKDNAISCVVDKENHMGQLALELKDSHPDSIADDPELLAALGDAENVLQFQQRG